MLESTPSLFQACGIVALTASIALASCTRGPALPSDPRPAQEPVDEAVAPPPPLPAPRPTRTVTLAAVGDVLPHRRVKASAAAHGWAWVFGDAVPTLHQADLAFANLESPIAPDHHRALYGEVFDAPADLAPALAEAGIDVVSLANNHAFDQGPDGLVETWTRVRAAGVAAAGAGPDCATATAPVRLEVHGVRIAVLAATDLSNLDLGAGPDRPCLFASGPACPAMGATECSGPDRDAVQFSHDRERLLAAVADARQGADFVVMSFHWGIEYQTAPLAVYPELARDLTDAGVDVLLGHHPHVLQPVEVRTTADGRTAVIAYSLGNFVSNMAEGYDPRRDAAPRGQTRDAVILEVALSIDGEGRPSVRPVRAIPSWTDNRPSGVRVRTLAALGADESVDPSERAALVAASLARIRGVLGHALVDGIDVTD